MPLADYFTGYRQTLRQPGELIKAIVVPKPLAPLTAFHKIAKRRFDDISSVAIAYAMTLADDGTVAEITIGIGVRRRPRCGPARPRTSCWEGVDDGDGRRGRVGDGHRGHADG